MRWLFAIDCEVRTTASFGVHARMHSGARELLGDRSRPLLAKVSGRSLWGRDRISALRVADGEAVEVRRSTSVRQRRARLR